MSSYNRGLEVEIHRPVEVHDRFSRSRSVRKGEMLRAFLIEISVDSFRKRCSGFPGEEVVAVSLDQRRGDVGVRVHTKESSSRKAWSA
jgi:hypothetical protein